MNFTAGIDFLHALDVKDLLTKPLCVEMAVVCAEHVFGGVPEESQKGCQEAIKAAKDWLVEPSEKNRRKAKRAASVTLPSTDVPSTWGASYVARTAAELVFKCDPYILASALEAARLGKDPVSEGKWQVHKIIEILHIRIELKASIYPTRWKPIERCDVARLKAIIRGVEGATESSQTSPH